MMKIIFHNGNIVAPGGVNHGDLIVEDELISAIGSNLGRKGQFDKVIDASDKFIIPGLIDAHVHMPWESDGVSSGDDFASGTRAAVYGGVTTIIDFAVPQVGESPSAAVQRRLKEANGACYTDFSIHAVINHFDESLPAEITRLVQRGIPSFKLYMLYPGLKLNSGEIYQAMSLVKDAGGMIMVHAEDGGIIQVLRNQFSKEGKRAPIYHYLSSPAIAEAAAVNQMLFLNKDVGGKLYFVHVSSAASLGLISQARKGGQAVYAETCPHYLTLTAEEYKHSNGYLFIVCPSLKTAEDRDALWAGIVNGEVNVVSTDHCPFTKVQKEEHRENFTAVPPGLPGVETRLPLLLTGGYWQRHVPLKRIVELTSYNPARIFGLFPKKGALQVGSDADLVVLDMNKEWILRHDNLHMNVDWSPYEGYSCHGAVDLVMRRGEILYESGEWMINSARGLSIPRKIN